MSTPARGPIRPLPCEALLDRSRVELEDVWVTGSPDATLATRAPLQEDDPVRFGQTPWDEPVAVALLRAPIPAGAVALLKRVAAARARLYVAADGDALAAITRELPRDAEVFARVVDAPVCAVLGHRSAQGVIWPAPLGETPRWALPVEPEEGEALLRAALHLFWREATEEGWLSSGLIKLAPPMDHQVETDPPGAASPVTLGAGGDRPRSLASLLYSPAGSADTLLGPGAVIFMPPTADVTAARAAAQAGHRVMWRPLGLPTVSMGAAGAAMDLGGRLGTGLGLTLTGPQRAALEGLLRGAVRAPAWVFHRKIALGKLSGEVLLPGTPEPAPVVATTTLRCPDVSCADLGEAATAAPPVPPLPPAARAVRLTWTNHPPVVPKDARPDALVDAWRSVDD